MIPLKDQGVKLFLQLMRAEHLNFISEMLGGVGSFLVAACYAG
jgi:hypothetical protein